MPAFRQQPLTWLFFLATACLDAVALTADNESSFANVLVLGQLFIASGWLVLGRSHRLARAAVFLATIGALTLPDYAIARLRHRQDVDLWPHVLAVLILVGLATAGATLCWLAMSRLLSRGLLPFKRSDWQFPVAELLGWMIIVAVACAGMPRADFSLIDGPKDVALGVATATLAGAVMALALGDYNEGRRAPGTFAAVFAAVVITVNAVVLAVALPANGQRVVVGALAYAACWAFVRRMDGRVAAAPAEQALKDEQASV